ncbi:fumarylacetoacetate hydrolase family protein [Paenarthrobacter sp. Z7-10]|uniref:fumarylacetoacetate hydrolase family protein n=1 Tax=Paenarthrobacter sp. Z7-10 TaxID=2787635 RepID=UPI0022A96B3D|nr:fumarylacetoacetate hydrolase family protein [Paenarthrobacter sp. Z7-10]MCZ2403749.1 fumarylacetoacetate hydrolase family protein [Paenarthrobacter sp. Z7-10]
MRLARVEHDGGPRWAVVDGPTLVLIEDPWPGAAVATGERVPLRGARLLPPATPMNVVGMAHNTGPADRNLPAQAFFKPARALTGPGSAIPIPPGIGRVDAEAELAVVIGRTARHLTPADALRHVLGFTLSNDVTARDLQVSDPLWTTAKGFDGWTPLGPWLETGLDPSEVQLTLSINGVPLESGSTANLARSVVEVLVYITSFMTLGPGDVVLTGAPGEVGRIQPGDRVSISSPLLGQLESTAAADPVPAAAGAES